MRVHRSVKVAVRSELVWKVRTKYLWNLTGFSWDFLLWRRVVPAVVSNVACTGHTITCTLFWSQFFFSLFTLSASGRVSRRRWITLWWPQNQNNSRINSKWFLAPCRTHVGWFREMWEYPVELCAALHCELLAVVVVCLVQQVPQKWELRNRFREGSNSQPIRRRQSGSLWRVFDDVSGSDAGQQIPDRQNKGSQTAIQNEVRNHQNTKGVVLENKFSSELWSVQIDNRDLFSVKCDRLGFRGGGQFRPPQTELRILRAEQLDGGVQRHSHVLTLMDNLTSVFLFCIVFVNSRDSGRAATVAFVETMLLIGALYRISLVFTLAMFYLCFCVIVQFHIQCLVSDILQRAVPLQEAIRVPINIHSTYPPLLKLV